MTQCVSRKWKTSHPTSSMLCVSHLGFTCTQNHVSLQKQSDKGGGALECREIVNVTACAYTHARARTLVVCVQVCIEMLTVYDPTKHRPPLLEPLNAKTYFDIAQGFVN